MHCHFLINTGNATGHDIETLGETVRERVKQNSGIELHWEIKRIGIWANLMRITILFGGTNKERLVSVASAQALHRALPEADLWFWHVNEPVHEVARKPCSITSGRSRTSSIRVVAASRLNGRSTRPKRKGACWCSACMAAGRRTGELQTMCEIARGLPSPGPARRRRISPSTRPRPSVLRRLRG